MAQMRELQRSFIGGELSPRMFGRPDDLRYQHGAAKLQNLVSLPQGVAQKRPGFRFVREIRNSSNQATLIPFAFSQDQTTVIEMGRDTIDSREIGYFRFHTDGGTVLYLLPSDYVTVRDITAINLPGDYFETSAAHGLSTGDPVVLTMHPTGEVVTSFTIADPGVVTHSLGTLPNDVQVMFEGQSGGTLPDELEERRLYYIRNTGAGTFEVSETQGGPSLEFTTAGAGTRWMSVMPGGSFRFDVGVTYYAIFDTATRFQLAQTKQDALDGTQKAIANAGSGDAHDDLRVHFDYQLGDLASNAGESFYCFRRPADVARWAPYVTTSMHAGYATSDTNFWLKESGEHATVTVNTSTEQWDWGSPHGFAENDLVIFSTTGTLPTSTPQVVAGVAYYIRNPSTDFFQVSDTPGGTAIDFTTTGSGTHTALVNSVFEAPHFFDFSELLEIRYAQSNDVLTLVHENRPAMELRRLGATRWVSEGLEFNPTVPPSDVTVTPFRGNGFKVDSMTVATPAVLVLNEALAEPHGIADNDTFYAQDLDPSVPDGFYRKHDNAGGVHQIDMWTVEDSVRVTSTGNTLGADPMVWPVTVVPDLDEVYVVTAIGENNEESRASDEVAVTNFLHNQNAYNTVTWSSVSGARRYRVYKKEIGVFGLVGEVSADQALSFDDENLAPDLSITPPILDEALRRTARVTFDATNARVAWEAHELVDGDPVVFRSTGTLPTALTDYTTYYVTNRTDDTFQVVADPADTVALSLTGADAEEIHEAMAGQFPSSVAYFEQRRVFGGSLTRRQRVRMTASATESDMSYSLPTVDSDRILFDVAAREAGAIRHVVPLSHLMILSGSTEFRVTPINDDAITPESISVRPQSFVGANKAQPVIASNVGVFAANRGGHVRQMGFSQDVISYLEGDLSLRATHLFNGLTISQMTYSKAPNPVLWFVSSSGKLLGLTYVPEESIEAWHQHVTDGTFEACASVAEGDEDHLYVIVKRNINGVDVRYIERMADYEVPALADAFFVDAGATYDGAATITLSGLDHLEGEAVTVLADGVVVSGLTVSAGAIILPTTASKIQVGLPFTARAETLPVTLALAAGGRGRTKNVNAVWVYVEESGRFTLGPLGGRLVPSKAPAAGALLTDSVDVNIPGSWSPHGQVAIEQSIPLPLTLVSVAYHVATGS
jgi:hypothetical protein